MCEILSLNKPSHRIGIPLILGSVHQVLTLNRSVDPFQNNTEENLKLLEIASESPVEACESDPLLQEAFEVDLRQLAEDIVGFHSGLAHVLPGMGKGSCDIIHGQN